MPTTQKTGAQHPRDPMIGFRASPVLCAGITQWAERQPDKPSLSEATRRLVELGLTMKGRAKRNGDHQRERAKEMAGSAIDKLAEAAASPDDKADRKRRLIKGPEEFRETRIDRSKKGSA